MIADFVIRRYWQNPQSLSCQANNIETAKERSILVKFGKNEHPVVALHCAFICIIHVLVV